MRSLGHTMGLDSMNKTIYADMDSSTMDSGSDVSTPQRFEESKLPSTSRLQPCDSSMFDLTLPFSHATSLVRRVFSESFLLLRLAVRLWTYLGVGWKWSVQLLRLVLYAALLLPGFLQMIVFYVFSPRVRRSVVYGPKPRQRLDLYFPPHPHPHAAYPVVIYVTGGAWTIGYKAWGALLARRLSDQGVLVACVDYRNFPQGDALDMLEDVNSGISWVLARVHRFGGDPDCVTLVGQSAGGHLAGLALIQQAQQAARGYPCLGASPSWSPACLRAFVGVSGAYDLAALADHLHRRGLYRSVFDRIMTLSSDTTDPSVEHRGGRRAARRLKLFCNGEGDCDGVGDCDGGDCGNEHVFRGGCCPGAQLGNYNGDCDGGRVNGDCGSEYSEEGDNGGAASSGAGASAASHDASGCRGGARPAYDALSPLQAARRLAPGAAELLPYVLLIHGTADKTVPAEGSQELSKALQAAGAPCVRCDLVPGKTHTAFLLEDPMRGGRDLLMDSVLGAVLGGGGGGEPQNHVYGTLCPGFLCDLAGMVCPF